MKTNPRKKPATQADVDRAKQDGMDFGISAAMAIMFSCLCDKFRWNRDYIQRLWVHVNELSEEIQQGRVSVADLRDTLKREYEVNV